MSESELSDGIEELEELIAEYEAKSKQLSKKNENVKIKKAPLRRKEKQSSKVFEVPMDKVLFDDKKGLLKNLAKAVGENSEENTDEEQNDEEKETKREAKKRKPVWIDVDDEEIQLGHVKRNMNMKKTYKEYLTAKFTRIMPQPKWASLERQPIEGDSDDEELLRTVGFLAKPTTGVLAPQHLNYKRLKDLNRSTYAEGQITSVQFHPTSTAALVAGDLGIATIYAVDGMKNEKLHSMRFKKFPIKCAKIKPCGTKAVFGANRNYYYTYDLFAAKETRYFLPRGVIALNTFQISPCGRYMAAVGQFGTFHLFDAQANELIHTFQQESAVANMRFTGDSLRLICTSGSSTVCIYSLRQQQLEHNFFDDGCIKGNVLDLSPNQRLLATGSKEGVVNVYDFDKVQQSRTPLPEKSFMNLTTGISDLKFNHSSELLAMCSKDVKSAVKIGHIRSGTVYSNFPNSKSAFDQIRSIDFSPNSGYLALGNKRKIVSLLRMKHFNNY